MANRFFPPVPQMGDASGVPYADGEWRFYITGTSTPADTYTDPDLAPEHVNENPLTLNERGEPETDVFLDPNVTYKAEVWDADGNLIRTFDPVVDPAANITAAIPVFAGNPNGQVAGNAGSVGGAGASAVFDITNGLLFICTTTGTASTAVWSQVAARLDGQLVFASDITPTALAANTNDWAPTGLAGASRIRLSADAARNLTGLTAQPDGTRIALENVGTFNVTILGNNAGSAAANRFLIPRPLVLRPSQSIEIEYDGTATGWRSLAPLSAQPVAAGFKNLVVTGTSNTVVTVTADALTLEDANGESYRALGVSLSIDITASGANGLDTGVEANDTWYSVWGVYNPTTNTLAGILSAHATAPTVPAGSTFKARVGWVRNSAAGNLWRSIQRGRRTQIIVGTNPTVIPPATSGVQGTYSATSPTMASVSLANFVPTTAAAVFLSVTNSWKGLTVSAFSVAPNTAWGGANNGLLGSAGNVWALGGGNTVSQFTNAWMALEAVSIAVASDAAGFAVGVLGWEDNL